MTLIIISDYLFIYAYAPSQLVHCFSVLDQTIASITSSQKFLSHESQKTLDSVSYHNLSTVYRSSHGSSFDFIFYHSKKMKYYLKREEEKRESSNRNTSNKTGQTLELREIEMYPNHITIPIPVSIASAQIQLLLVNQNIFIDMGRTFNIRCLGTLFNLSLKKLQGSFHQNPTRINSLMHATYSGIQQDAYHAFVTHVNISIQFSN